MEPPSDPNLNYPPPPGPLSPPPESYRQKKSADSSIQWNNSFNQQHPPISRIPLAPPVDSNDYYSKFSLSSYNHPHEIPPPRDVYTPNTSDHPRPLRSALRRSVSFAQDPGVKEFEPDDQVDEHEEMDSSMERAQKRRGIPSQMIQLYGLNREIEMEQHDRTPKSSFSSSEYTFQRPNYRRLDSMASASSEVFDEYDPRITGVRAEHLDDHEDLEKNALRQMDYRSRRKHLMRVKIEFNVVCEHMMNALANLRTN
ncbi:hypothetical protein E1B28_004209 [Marasmius oreades]|uniref:Uncharacterized protein n=1 Tax=Marasmius oreades TaxID=181124 RepID=A0A9P7UY93_9AGAR|nr:uncharacterized protein E1B28_004209 [Marasmius oreades]KAG7096800.1 hypothetical protein E1B28_004209 [Marasmius oreades]